MPRSEGLWAVQAAPASYPGPAVQAIQKNTAAIRFFSRAWPQ